MAIRWFGSPSVVTPVPQESLDSTAAEIAAAVAADAATKVATAAAKVGTAAAKAGTAAAITAEALAIGDEAAVTSAINAAVAIGTGDASVEVLAIQTAFNALKVHSALASTAVGSADTLAGTADTLAGTADTTAAAGVVVAAGLGVSSPAKSFKLVLDMAQVTTKRQLDKLWQTIRANFDANNILAP